MNILVRMPNWIGDLVMATPVLTDLRQKFPEASITAMCRSPLSELLEQDEAIDELFSFNKLSNQFLRREPRDIVEKVKQGKFDTALLLTNSFSSAWLFYQAKIPQRIGYTGHFRRLLLTDAVKKPKSKMHQVDLYKHLLGTLEIEPSLTEPRLYLSEKEISLAKERLYVEGYKKNDLLIGINPGAAYGSAKCWPPERFKKLASLLAENAYVVFFGDTATLPLVKEICKDMPKNVLNLAGLTTLRELASLIKACDLLITNDSGPMHIAAALKTPLIALFGSTDEELTGPYQNSDAVICKKVHCSPCFKRECPIDFRCMREISVEEVMEKVKKHV